MDIVLAACQLCPRKAVKGMLVFSDRRNLPTEARGAVVALGNFDGVHLGHLALLAAARARADETGCKLAVLTFEPHPRQFFQPDGPAFRLTTAEEKARLLAANGVDLLYVLPFDAALAEMSAADFETNVLQGWLGASAIVAGRDFRFGKGRAGALDMLSLPTLSPAATIDQRGQQISSTLVREALAGGDPQRAAALLGRAWTIDYTVETGDKRGRELGYPTANGQLGQLMRPAYGIYAVRAWLEDGRELTGAANIGVRPMWQSDQPLVETFLFDFDGDIYDQTLRIALVGYLRPEARFADIQALKDQMAKDCAKARTLLAIND